MENKLTEAEIERIAIDWVCPLNHHPTTSYEIGEVKRLVRFAEDVILALGLVNLPPDSAILEGISNLKNLGIEEWD